MSRFLKGLKKRERKTLSGSPVIARRNIKSRSSKSNISHVILDL